MSHIARTQQHRVAGGGTYRTLTSSQNVLQGSIGLPSLLISAQVIFPGDIPRGFPETPHWAQNVTQGPRLPFG